MGGGNQNQGFGMPPGNMFPGGTPGGPPAVPIGTMIPGNQPGMPTGMPLQKPGQPRFLGPPVRIPPSGTGGLPAGIQGGPALPGNPMLNTLGQGISYQPLIDWFRSQAQGAGAAGLGGPAGILAYGPNRGGLPFGRIG